MRDLKVAVREGKVNPWFAFFLEYMPLPTAKQVTCPVLILHGDKDAHAPVEHAHYLAQAMRSGGNTDVTVRIFKDINHVFLHDKDGRKSGYLKLLRNGAEVPDSVLDTITEWFVDRLSVDL
jgi:dipeptidyl aminopeptidase/acylaminoacyl peptidase